MEFSVNTERFDLYKNFKFRVKCDGKYVAGISKVSGLEGNGDVVVRGGGAPLPGRPLPGRPAGPAITLDRCITHDAGFETWADLVNNPHSPGGMTLEKFRKNIRIEQFDETGRLALAYDITGCWVSEYQALPDLDANANAVAIEHMKLENEGWERDTSVQEPAEPGIDR